MSARVHLTGRGGRTRCGKLIYRAPPDYPFNVSVLVAQVDCFVCLRGNDADRAKEPS